MHLTAIAAEPDDACPSEEALAGLGLDSRTGPDFHRISDHIERCEHCQRVLDRLSDASSDVRMAAVPPRLPALAGYEVESLLGRGGMGIVYRARAVDSGLRVAIKIVPCVDAADPGERRRRLREARMLARIPPHRNVVRLHHAWIEGNSVLIALELVTGGNLRDRLAGPMPPRRAAEVLRLTARGSRMPIGMACFISTSSHPISCSMESRRRPSPSSPTSGSRG